MKYRNISNLHVFMLDTCSCPHAFDSQINILDTTNYERKIGYGMDTSMKG